MRLKPEFDRFLSNADREWLADQTDPATALRSACWPRLSAFCSQVCPNLPEWQAWEARAVQAAARAAQEARAAREAQEAAREAWEEARAAREEAREALLPFLLPMIEAE